MFSIWAIIITLVSPGAIALWQSKQVTTLNEEQPTKLTSTTFDDSNIATHINRIAKDQKSLNLPFAKLQSDIVKMKNNSQSNVNKAVLLK
ncbi:MAG: hypothetical protein GY726_04220 [Proteobacteria bacterium]|nr:hypothetical protein [Pseudomonadota bacterium]